MKWVAGLVLMAACSDRVLTLEEYPAARLASSCDFFMRCGVIPTIEECRATQAERRFATDLIRAVNAGTVRWHGDAAEDCVDQLDGLSCDRTSERNRSYACDRLFTGTLAENEACTMSVECISNECWTEGCTDACCVGYCVGNAEPEIGEIGEPCRLSGCVAGARCESSVCVPLRDEGEMCFDQTECAFGLACIDRVCAVPDYNGDPCSESSCAMAGELCGFHGVCEPIGQLGYPCSQDSHCGINYTCGGDSRCTPAPSVGQRCSPYSERCFDAGAFCDLRTDLCTLPKPDGASCSWSGECQSQRCPTGTCISCSEVATTAATTRTTAGFY